MNKNMEKNSMFKKMILTSVAVVSVMAFTPAAHANEGTGVHEIVDVPFSFKGPFGTYDKAALQRGLMVYRQVCSACHSLKRVAYRNLEELGYSPEQVKTIAGEYTIVDGPNDEGEMFERPGRPSDRFKSPFVNDKAAAAANGGAFPPDLSLITKARHDGADYVYSLLTGYAEAPHGMVIAEGKHYNKAMDGNVIAMPPPLSDGAVTYEDGSPQIVSQYAKDVATFLTWAAEPELEHRKQMGVKVVLFLSIFAVIMYAVKRQIWKKVH